MGFRSDRDAIYARSDALARELEATKEKLAEKEEELALALNPAEQEEPASGEPSDEAPNTEEEGSAGKDKIEEQESSTSAGSTSLLLRLLSITKHRFGIFFFDIPVVIGLIVVLYDPGALVNTAVVLLGLGTLLVALDSYRRRCPKCRRFLAGKSEGVALNSYGENLFSWRCVFCQRFWKTRRLK